MASKVGDALRPNSVLLRRLRTTRPKAKPVQYTAFVGGSDNVVIPRIFASNGDDVILLPNVGHLGILFSPLMFRAVADRLVAPLNVAPLKLKAG